MKAFYDEQFKIAATAAGSRSPVPRVPGVRMKKVPVPKMKLPPIASQPVLAGSTVRNTNTTGAGNLAAPVLT